MAADLRDTDIDPSRPEYRLLLENLQGNILKPHGRTESNFLFLRFTAGSDAMRAWIRDFARREVTSAWKQHEATRELHDNGRRGGLVVGLSLAAKGYERLGLVPRNFGPAGEVFRKGMKHRAFSLFARNRDPPAAEWAEPFRGEIHALVSLSDESADAVEAKTREVSHAVRPIAKVLTIERGTVLRNAKGDPIEHFGYVDARSQPLFFKEDIDEEREAGIDRWDPSALLNLVLVDDPFTEAEDAFGSFLVFRKLRQDVEGFNAGVRFLASKLRMDEALAGALVVGRFKDGSPVTSQSADGLGAVNNFEYLAQDPVGTRCPFHAHIRKANQRGANRRLGAEEERRRRIVRRGLPYGVRSAAPAGRPTGSGGRLEKGLLFICFQGDIGRQFEFIQRTWSDNPNFPEFRLFQGLNTGDDALIGQKPEALQRWPQRWGVGGRYVGRQGFNFGGYVTLRGGEYLFTPSLPFLTGL